MNPHRSAADAAPANPHVPWRQALGLVFWAGLAAIPAILAGQPLVVVLGLALIALTAASLAAVVGGTSAGAK